MSNLPDDPKVGWDAFIDGLRVAVDRMDELTVGLDPVERADGFRVLTHSLGVQLEAMEMDRRRPVPIPHNTWQTKFLMDNPDGLYWTCEIDPTLTYRVSGSVGEAAYTAIALYEQREKWHDTAQTASIDGTNMTLGPAGEFELTLGGAKPASGDWLPVGPRTRTVWFRQFYNDVYRERHGQFSIEPLGEPGPPPIVEPALLAERLAIGGKKLRSTTSAIRHGIDKELAVGNHVRTWSEMHGGAVFTSSDIWYQRGAWSLAADEALVLDGQATPSTFWNIVLYSRFLNSLEHRYRPVSLTGGRATVDADGRYRLVIAARDPGGPNWLDTEGRAQGMFALRWVHPAEEPPLPTASVVPLSELG